MGAQPVHVAFVVAAFDKTRQGQLIDSADGAGVKSQFAPETVRQCGRQNQVADTKRRSQAFRKGVGVNHLPRCINALKRRDGASRKAELAIVVIFNKVPIAL